MSSFLPEMAAAHAKELMGAAFGEMKKIQPTPLGTRERTPREQNALFDKMNGLPRDELQSMMMTMAENAGHTDEEKQPCDLCKFLGDQAARKAAKSQG